MEATGGHKGSFGGDGNIMKVDRGDGGTALLNSPKIIQLCN